MSKKKESSDRSELFGGMKENMPTRNVMKDDFGFEIPVENVPLPSMGKVYPEDSACHNKETLEIRAMTAREEDILTSPNLLKQGTAIDKLLEALIVDKKIQLDNVVFSY